VSDRLTDYRRADTPLPKINRLWPLYGAGFENLGRDGQPIEVEMSHHLNCSMVETSYRGLDTTRFYHRAVSRKSRAALIVYLNSSHLPIDETAI
jgi:hypothetical protein